MHALSIAPKREGRICETPMLLLLTALDPEQDPVCPHLLIGLNVPDQVVQGIDALVNSEGELVVLCSQEVCHFPCGYQIRRALDPHAKGVQRMLRVKGVLGLLHVPATSAASCSDVQLTCRLEGISNSFWERDEDHTQCTAETACCELHIVLCLQYAQPYQEQIAQGHFL